ncbi:GrpB family protein [Gloeocapsopsis sp. IPPAS B-1203]|uniref:GrpB family protein n=1 Tax=Gloeocapsopsis sp. IPPAS B-1203 TaxID=2049454 RepID=UPI000C1A082C|nr:GrpB family protein [Gloeocapsopsis sp. IPPAS B-1203]PIG95276.1 hypothetical protein CSQ79_02150 [Gloeocapsopsis sp. IPPAS B-1203]
MALLVSYQLTDSKVVPYNPKYPEIFQLVKALISIQLPNIEIEHIGSTAIPGIYAKPIIDILIPCSKQEFTDVLNKLKAIGFEDTPFANIPSDRPMLVARINFQQNFYNIHLHLTPEGSDVHLNNIFFREQLRQNPTLAQEYDRLKKAAVTFGIVEATAYNTYKSPFIQSVLQQRIS